MSGLSPISPHTGITPTSTPVESYGSWISRIAYSCLSRLGLVSSEPCKRVLGLGGIEKPSPINPETWMGELSEGAKNMPLRDLPILGTHDSAAYKFNFTSPPIDNEAEYAASVFASENKMSKEFINSWFLAQKKDVLSQLKDGMRYLDLRVIFSPSESGKTLTQFFGAHGFKGPSMIDIFQQIDEFLREHPSEVLIIEAKANYEHRTVMEPHVSEFYDCIKEHLGKNLYCRKGESSALEDDISLNELVKQNKRVIFFYRQESGSSDRPYIWDGSLINDMWDDTSSVKEKFDGFKRRLVAACPSKTNFYNIRLQFTPQAADLEFSGLETLMGLAAQFRQSLQTFNLKFRALFTPFFQKNYQLFRDKVWIYSVDFSPYDDQLGKCVSLAEEKAKNK
jgi:hypothetical protein